MSRSQHHRPARRAWVTGASSGIGEALVRRLLDEGWEVIVTARREDSLRALCESAPERCWPLALDLTDAEQLAGARARLEALTGHLDAVVINAGNCEYIEARDFSAAPFARLAAINVQGAAHTLELALPLLRAVGRGAQVVGVSSLVTRLPLPRSEAYGASKAALEYLLASLRVDLAIEGIDVTLVRPGFVKTPLSDRNDFPMPFRVSPEYAAARIWRGMRGHQYRVQFPWQLVCLMRLVGWLPLPVQLWLLKKLVRR